jgi:universal stress protein A
MTGPEPRRFPLDTILVPTDFSPCSDRAFGYALQLAQAFGGRLVLLHVLDSRIIENVFHIHQMEEEDVRGEMAARADRQFAEFRERVAATDVRIEHETRAGIPAREIIAAAKELGANLIVIGSHGATGLREILYGTTAEGVVRGAPCPVLSVGENGE